MFHGSPIIGQGFMNDQKLGKVVWMTNSWARFYGWSIIGQGCMDDK